MKKTVSCKCVSGCNTKRCNCFKNNKTCDENCDCSNCKNRQPDLSVNLSAIENKLNEIAEQKKAIEEQMRTLQQMEEGYKKLSQESTNLAKQSADTLYPAYQSPYDGLIKSRCRLSESGFILSENALLKMDIQGKLIENFDLKDIQQIVVQQKRAYGCIVLAVIFIYIGILTGYLFASKEIGLSIAIVSSILGLILVWMSSEMYNCFFSFRYKELEFIYKIYDPKEKILLFLEKLKETIQNKGYKIDIKNMLEEENESEEPEDSIW